MTLVLLFALPGASAVPSAGSASPGPQDFVRASCTSAINVPSCLEWAAWYLGTLFDTAGHKVDHTADWAGDYVCSLICRPDGGTGLQPGEDAAVRTTTAT